MRINFVTRGGPHLASYRLRCPPGAEVGAFREADAHVFAKHWADERALAAASPCPIFDVCDDHFSGPHGDYYREMCQICHVTASSEALCRLIFEETGRDAYYIPEPWEGPLGVPREPGIEPLVLWFGHAANLGELQRVLPVNRLMVCTNVSGSGVIPWSLESQWAALRACDVVIIPQSRGWKSANRMVESLRAGRFVIAEDIPAYRGFGQWLGDIHEGLEWLKDSGPITDRIIFGQERLTPFSPESVGKRWLDYISERVRSTTGAMST